MVVPSRRYRASTVLSVVSSSLGLKGPVGLEEMDTPVVAGARVTFPPTPR